MQAFLEKLLTTAWDKFGLTGLAVVAFGGMLAYSLPKFIKVVTVFAEHSARSDALLDQCTKLIFDNTKALGENTRELSELAKLNAHHTEISRTLVDEVRRLGDRVSGCGEARARDLLTVIQAIQQAAGGSRKDEKSSDG